MTRHTYRATRRDRDLLHRMVDRAIELGAWVTFKQDKRTTDQNSLLWALLTDVSRQAEWAGKKREPEEWKDLFTASVLAAKGGLEIVPGLMGGFVILGLRTSDMTRAEMGDLIDWITAWGSQNGVTFSGPDAANDDERRAAA
jgi:hypothetical protein